MKHNFPLFWIKWFETFYNKVKDDDVFKKYPTCLLRDSNPPKNDSGRYVKSPTKIAVLIEPREHFMIKYVAYNFMYFLIPKGWGLHIFCGTKNHAYVREVTRQLPNVTVNVLPYDNFPEPLYNQILKQADLYRVFGPNVSHILVFQTDTILLKNNIEDFLKYDFIGAAWKFSPHKGCNGGLSLRNVKKMIEICSDPTRRSEENEDGFFSFTNEDKLNLVPTLHDKNNFSIETMWHDDPLGMHKPYGFHEHDKIMELMERAWKRIFNTDISPFDENDVIMKRDEVLNSVKELGYVEYVSETGKFFLIPAQINVYNNSRLKIFIDYLVEYISKFPSNGFSYFFTVYDAWREHSEYCAEPVFVNSTPNLLKEYEGFGSGGEPGRFIPKNTNTNVFPVFDKKVLAFGRHKNDPYTILLPDADFMKSRGYKDLLKEIDQKDTIDWNNKYNTVFWRGGLHGIGYKRYNRPDISIFGPYKSQRQLLVEYSILKENQQFLDVKNTNFGRWFSAEGSYSTDKSEFLRYKYMIDVDGEVNAWSALWWKLYANCVVFKIDSHYEQWYYKDIKPWVHYIPVKGDLSDMEDMYRWAVSNDERCMEINKNATDFIKKMTYEYVLTNYKI